MAQRSKTGNSGSQEIDRSDNVPGPTENPAANLMMADIIMRSGSYILRAVVERSLLKGRYGKEAAREIVAHQPASQKLASFAIAKLASRSLPGAALLGTGLLARTLYSRGKARRKARQQGDAALLQQTED